MMMEYSIMHAKQYGRSLACTPLSGFPQQGHRSYVTFFFSMCLLGVCCCSPLLLLCPLETFLFVGYAEASTWKRAQLRTTSST